MDTEIRVMVHYQHEHSGLKFVTSAQGHDGEIPRSYGTDNTSNLHKAAKNTGVRNDGSVLLGTGNRSRRSG